MLQSRRGLIGWEECYLGTMSTFEDDDPSMRFILMTGHTDGSDTATEPDGNDHPTTTDACEWCAVWCEAHAADCTSVPDCAHSHGFNCIRKAKEFWVMMARLAGWNR